MEKKYSTAEERRQAERESQARHFQMEAAEFELAEAVVHAHRILGAAIDAARREGIEDPHTLIAGWMIDLARLRAAEEVRHEGV